MDMLDPVLDENDPTIISVLHHLEHGPLPTMTEAEAGLEGWTVEQLRQEVIRLREGARTESLMEYNEPPRKRAKKERKLLNPTSEATGKRVESKRKVELQKAIREKMMTSLGVGKDDPLPAPSQGELFVPEWSAGLNEPFNVEWVNRMVKELREEAGSPDRWPSIPEEDLDESLVSTAARTAFMNYCKKYAVANDEKAAERKEKYVKQRRRWARKDLKQKRRAKAAADPSFTDDLPPSALHLDYMSSEYSSGGEDATEGQSREWGNALAEASVKMTAEEKKGKGGWADGVSEKVLEVRTPSWRSARLHEIYGRLDAIASHQVALRSASSSVTTDSRQRAGHVAPSHRRFTMEQGEMRSGKRPKNVGEGWMWASGEVGVWPLDQGTIE